MCPEVSPSAARTTTRVTMTRTTRLRLIPRSLSASVSVDAQAARRTATRRLPQPRPQLLRLLLRPPSRRHHLSSQGSPRVRRRPRTRASLCHCLRTHWRSQAGSPHPHKACRRRAPAATRRTAARRIPAPTCRATLASLPRPNTSSRRATTSSLRAWLGARRRACSTQTSTRGDKRL